MKQSTKILLILAAVFISLGLILALIGFMLGVNPVKLIEQGHMDLSFSGDRSSDFSSEGRYVIPTGSISEIELNWTSGEIQISVHDGKDIILQESSAADFNENNSLVFEELGGRLRISEFAPRAGIYFSAPELQRKDLKMSVPADMLLREFQINSVSSQLSIGDLKLNELEIESVSGDLKLEGLSLGKLNISSVSGRIDITDSDVKKLSAENVSGNLSAELLAAPLELDFESVSGSAELYLPEDSQFTLSMDSISGKLDSQFEGRYSGDELIVGKGSSEFEFETTGGDVKIYKRA